MHQYQCFEELTVYSTDTCAMDYEKGNTLVKNHITKCIIKINYTACAHGPESFAKGREIYFDIKIELLSCYVFLFCQQHHVQFLHLYPQKNSLEVENYFQS